MVRAAGCFERSKGRLRRAPPWFLARPVFFLRTSFSFSFPLFLPSFFSSRERGKLLKSSFTLMTERGRVASSINSSVVNTIDDEECGERGGEVLFFALFFGVGAVTLGGFAREPLSFTFSGESLAAFLSFRAFRRCLRSSTIRAALIGANG